MEIRIQEVDWAVFLEETKGNKLGQKEKLSYSEVSTEASANTGNF